MRVAVVSDIHANYHALSAVLDEIAIAAPDQLWCLGDIVGYGPEPNRCASAIAARADVCLAGNHDLAVIGKLSVDEFNGDAAAAVRWTQKVIDDDTRAFLSSLSPSAHAEGVALFHGSPLDPVWDYVLSEEGARLSLELCSDPIVLVGHSHVMLALSYDGARIGGGLASGGETVDLNTKRWLLNPGSVGQPRGGDPRAAWMLLDLDKRQAQYRRTNYSISATQEAIRAVALPDSLATRLGLGG
jgi:predicted phosphodiesterase